MEFLKAFTSFAKKQSLEIDYGGPCRGCKLIEAIREPYVSTYYGGYCDTCSYTEGCVRFEGRCSKNKQHTYVLKYFDFGTMIRELTDLK